MACETTSETTSEKRTVNKKDLLQEQARLWKRYTSFLCCPDGMELRIDPSRMEFPDGFFDEMAPKIAAAFDAMEALEKGAIANPDESRRVGHYWLRDAGLAPDGATRAQIEKALADLHAFVREERAKSRFDTVLVVGIGGSALGPQFVADALGALPDGSGSAARVFFFDNTDPDGMDRVLGEIRATPGGLERNLVIVISKSGGTPETRNGMLEARWAYEAAHVDFASHAVAITQEGSALDGTARKEKWLARFPMWDWVGGRTSETSAVGLLPAALQGIDIDSLLAGARAMDRATRERDALRNPAALLALMWHFAGEGRGAKNMVVLPYKDRLLLLSRYLQQLVMESLGKELDLEGRRVEQGLVVYGNKGSTDQHAYIQQLRDGTHDFFVTFIEVLEDRSGDSKEVEKGATSGDYLAGLRLGTRNALASKHRGSITITIPRVDAPAVGQLIALFERAVGLYAALIDINAYHQPGVQAGKDAANEVLEIQKAVWTDLEAHAGLLRSVEQIAVSAGVTDVETVFHVLEHRAANPLAGGLVKEAGKRPFDSTYGLR